GEGGELGVDGVDAERAAGDFVLPERLPGPADRQGAQAQRHEIGDEGQDQDDVVEKYDPVQGAVVQPEEIAEAVLRIAVEPEPEQGRVGNAGYAPRAVGELAPIDQHDADDLA